MFGRPLTERQEGRFILVDEPPNVVNVPPEEVGDLLRATVSEANPNHLRRCAPHDAEAVEVLVFRNK